uniref:non-specific serine/threonine protein kinase n=1 Tax=Latimeria chalumnae TaxID=7897 RepID=H3AXS0_LATCH
LLQGGDLSCVIRERQNSNKLFSEVQVLEWFIQLLLGVRYLHKRLVLHRDLKASNIFLKDGTLKIVVIVPGDFGVSRILLGALDFASTFTGTPHYMSPEVFTCSGYNSKSDIWSLGCVLYEICALDLAFDARSWVKLLMKIVHGPSPSLPESFSEELNHILHRMLNKDPMVRPSAAEILKLPYVAENVKVRSLFILTSL